MAVLITGGCGYIGSHCAVALLNVDYRVILLDNLSTSTPKRVQGIEKLADRPPAANKPLIVHKADVTQKQQLQCVFQAHPIQAVIHCAGLKSVSESNHDPLKYYSTNVLGLINILEVMNEYNVTKLIFSSSATVYTETDTVLSEGSPTAGLQSKSVYGITKCIDEQIIRDVCAAGKLNAVCLRYFNPIGHSDPLMADTATSNLIPRILEVIDTKERLAIYGTDYATRDGTAIRDYIHVEDLAQGHLAALELEVSGYRVFNLGTGVGYTVDEIVRTVKSLGVNLEVVQAPRRDGDVPMLVADNTLAKQELHWQPQHDLRGMLHSCLGSKL